MIRTTLVAVLALVPALTLAQGGAPSLAGGGAPGPAMGVPAPAPAATAAPAADPDALDPTAAPAPAPDGAPSGAAPDTYTIKPGDTLWDLSGRFLNNPWYWPKIWSYNPDIANPHWIYPGNILKFYPSADEGPTRVEPVGPGTPLAKQTEEAAPEEEVAEVRELEDFSKANMKAPASAEEAEAVAVAGPYKIGFVAPRARLARHDTFVTPRELAESGAIHASSEEKLMLANLDRAYAQFENGADVKVGETYVVYKTERAIAHPDKPKEIIGYQSVVLGSAKVVAVEDKAATLVIQQSFEPIERGALLGPWTQKFFRPVERKPNKHALDGQIVGAQVEVMTQLGENHVVFVDRGEKDGVEEGNVFVVLRSGDPYGQNPHRGHWDDSLPIEAVGELMVIDVKDHASTALVTRSLKELMIGDRVEMRPAAGSGGN
jgi:hypothetical protein